MLRTVPSACRTSQLAQATNGVDLSDPSCGAHPVKTQCQTRTYRAAALRCDVKTRCSRRYTCSQSDLDGRSQENGKLKLSKAEKRLENKRKRKLRRQALPDTGKPCDSPIGPAQVDAARPLAETSATSAGASSGGGVSSSPTVHVTYEAEVEVVMNTGQFRIVRRLLAAVGLPVLRLRRTAVGCVSFDALAAAGAPLERPGDSVLLPAPLLEQLWQTVGGAEAVWRRRLAALRAKCGECSDDDDTAGTQRVDDNPSSTSEGGEAELQRLRQWLRAHGLLKSDV